MKTANLDILERSQLPAAQARAILQVMESEMAAQERPFATKADLDLAVHGIELKFEGIRTDMQALRAELIGEIKGTVRWNFAFWVTQLAALAAILKLLK